MIEINKIYNADCLEVIKELPDKTVNLVIIDPPYNINKAEWDAWENQLEYIEWLGQIFKEIERILTDNGSFYFFHNDFLQIVELQNFINKNTDFIFKQLIVWNKKFIGSKKEGFLQGYNELKEMRNYQKFAEYLLFYVKETAPAYLKSEFERAGVSKKEIAKLFPSKKGGLTGCVSNWLLGRENISEEKYLKIREYLGEGYLLKDYKDLYYTFNNQKLWHSVWNFEIADKSQNGHLTPKPVKLIETIIKYSSNENDLVLDCFSGSGTTAIASYGLKRNFICIEKDENYYNLSLKRLNAKKMKKKLF